MCSFIHYFGLCWVFVAVCGHSLAVVCGLLTAVALLWWLLGLSMGPIVAGPGLLNSGAALIAGHGQQGTGPVVVAHGHSGSVACGIFPDQGSSCVSYIEGGFSYH